MTDVADKPCSESIRKPNVSGHAGEGPGDVTCPVALEFFFSNAGDANPAANGFAAPILPPRLAVPDCRVAFWFGAASIRRPIQMMEGF
jgi:hypothetical protein